MKQILRSAYPTDGAPSAEPQACSAQDDKGMWRGMEI